MAIEASGPYDAIVVRVTANQWLIVVSAHIVQSIPATTDFGPLLEGRHTMIEMRLNRLVEVIHVKLYITVNVEFLVLRREMVISLEVGEFESLTSLGVFPQR